MANLDSYDCFLCGSVLEFIDCVDKTSLYVCSYCGEHISIDLE